MTTESDSLGALPDGTGSRRDWLIELVEDRPVSGMWHTGPNAGWVTVTHLPTMISARMFDMNHFHARNAAFACCEMMVDESRLLKCQFPDRLTAQGIEAPSGGETRSGSTEGKSPVAAGHAPEPCIASPNPTTKGESK